MTQEKIAISAFLSRYDLLEIGSILYQKFSVLQDNNGCKLHEYISHKLMDLYEMLLICYRISLFEVKSCIMW